MKTSTLAIAALVGAAAWRGSRRAHAQVVRGVPGDIEFSEYPFPPRSAGRQWNRMRILGAIAEDLTGIQGLRDYLLGTAKSESNGFPSTINDKSDAEPAFDLLCADRNYHGRYKSNPWRPSRCRRGDPLASRWAYSGGWFGMMPATALATSDKRAHKHDPARVFDPPFAVAYASDLVRRLRIGYGAETWGDIRAGWGWPSLANPADDSNGKKVRIERFTERLEQVAHFGVNTGLAAVTVRTNDYPGFRKVLHTLLNAEKRT